MRLALLLTLISLSSSAADRPDPFAWHGPVAPGLAVEIRGLNGDVHAEFSSGTEVEVYAQVSGADPVHVLQLDACLPLVDTVDGEPHAAALDDGHLLVRMRVHWRVDVRLQREAAHHQPLADDHPAIDPVGNPLRGDVVPLTMKSGVCWHVALVHQVVAQEPASDVRFRRICPSG